jgi:hypothetical protein
MEWIGEPRLFPHKEYCEAEFDIADDKKKVLVKGVVDLETSFLDPNDGVKAFDKQVPQSKVEQYTCRVGLGAFPS